MNVADEASRSCWMDAMPEVAAPPLTGKAECDLAVIGKRPGMGDPAGQQQHEGATQQSDEDCA